MSVTDYELIEPDAHAVARDIVEDRKRRNKSVVKQVELAAAITNIQHNPNIKGADAVVISLFDEDWTLMDSGFLDADDNGEIDPIDINYPDGSRYWYRLTQVSPKADNTVQLTFMTREAVYLMHIKGPFKADRAKSTRAQFLKACAGRVKEGDGIEFYSLELDKKQKIAALPKGSLGTASSSKQPKGQAGKSTGIGGNKGLTVQGVQASAEQIRIGSEAIRVGQHKGASDIAILACLYAAIGETGMKDVASPYSNGPWQAKAGHYNNGHDITGMAEGFYDGGLDFGNGGAIALSRRSSNIVAIANAVENNAVYEASGGNSQRFVENTRDSYAGRWPGGSKQGIAEAKAWLTAGGGAGSTSTGPGGAAIGSVTTIEAYYFEILPHENFWTGMNRLAGEVNWELFLDGNRMYYDSEQVLIRQKVAAHLHRNDAEVLDWDYDWDVRDIVTQMTLVVECDITEFAAGEVFQVDGLWVASTSSTARPRLPGRWLIQSGTRNKGDIGTSFTLKQPEMPKLEPAPQIKSTPAGAAASGLSSGSLQLTGTVGAKVAQVARLAVQRQKTQNAYRYSEAYDRTAAARAGLFAKAPVVLDCSGFACLCYLEARGPDPGGVNFAYLSATGTMEPHGTRVSLSQAQPGDLVFYPGHVAVYLGNNEIANHGSPGEPVIESVLAPHGGAITSIRRYS